MIVHRLLPGLLALSLHLPGGWSKTPDPSAPVQRLTREIRHLTGEQRQAERQLARAEKQIARLNRRLGALEQERHGLQRQQRQLHQELETLRQKLRDRRRWLAAQIRAAYLLQRRGGLPLLFSGRSPGEIQRLLVYYRHLTQAQATRLRQLQTQLSRLQALEARNRQLLARLETLAAERRETLAVLKQQRQARRQALTALQRQLADRRTRLRKFKADQNRLQHLVRAVSRTAEASAPKTDFLHRKGKLPWPVAGRLAVRFGARRGSGRWEGVILKAPSGTPVKAVHAGKVIFAGWMPGYGNLLIIRHDHGFLTLYGFTRELYKQIGDRVEAGETIATVGDSGGQARPGLYFSIRRGSRPVDPERWCHGNRHGRKG